MRPSPSLNYLTLPSAQTFNNKLSPFSFTYHISSPLITTADYCFYVVYKLVKSAYPTYNAILIQVSVAILNPVRRNKTNKVIDNIYFTGYSTVIQSMQLIVYEPLPHLRGEGGCYLVG